MPIYYLVHLLIPPRTASKDRQIKIRETTALQTLWYSIAVDYRMATVDLQS